MTLTTSHNRKSYTASVGQTVFPYDFLVTASTDLLVYVNTVLQAAANYTVSGVGVGSGGNVTLATACAGGEVVVLYRRTDTTQQVNLVEGDRLPSDVVEGMVDKEAAVTQDLGERVGRAIKIPLTSTAAGTEFELPDPALVANWSKALRIKGDGTAIEGFTVLPTDIASPITAKGDLIRGSTGASPERLPIGIDGQLLTVSSGQAAWVTPSSQGIPVTIMDAKGDLIVGTAADSALRKAVGTTGSVLMADPSTSDGLTWLLGAALHGRVQLIRTGSTQVALMPRDGSTLYVKDANGWRLMSVGTGLSATNTSAVVNGVAGSTLAANTTYLVTVFENGGSYALDFLTTTVHIPDSSLGFGVETAIGSTFRTVVGMVRTNASGQFQDNDAARGVRSWFNEPGVVGRKSITADRTTSGTTFGLLNAEATVALLLWSGELVTASVSGECTNSNSNVECRTGIGFDSSTAPEPGVNTQTVPFATLHVSAACSAVRTDLAEGLHAVNVLVAVASGTGTWAGAVSPRAVTLNISTLRR